jgi:hypothetical protein
MGQIIHTLLRYFGYITSIFDSTCAHVTAMFISSTYSYTVTMVITNSGLEIREHGRKDPSRWTRGTLYPQKLALTSSISDGLSV